MAFVRVVLTLLIASGLFAGNAVAATCSPTAWLAELSSICNDSNAVGSTPDSAAASCAGAYNSKANPPGTKPDQMLSIQVTSVDAQARTWTYQVFQGGTAGGYGTAYLTAREEGCIAPPAVPDPCVAEIKALVASGTTNLSMAGVVSSGASCMKMPAGTQTAVGKGCKVNFQVDLTYGATTNHPRTDGVFVPVLNAGGDVVSSACSLAAPAPVVNKCPDGYPGTFNGADVCVPRDKNDSAASAAKKVTVTTNADGSQTTVTQTTSTTCSGAGSCSTTTTTSTSVGGGAPSTTSTTSDVKKADFCASNPTDRQCVASPDKPSDGSFSGGCGVPPVCTGDALQCAIASATFTTRCSTDALQTDKTDSVVKAGYSAIGGVQSDSDNPRKMKVEKDIGSLDQSNPFGNDGGLSDSVINLGPRLGTLTLPWSAYNGILVMMGKLAVGLTLLSSAFYVAKGSS